MAIERANSRVSELLAEKWPVSEHLALTESYQKICDSFGDLLGCTFRLGFATDSDRRVTGLAVWQEAWMGFVGTDGQTETLRQPVSRVIALPVELRRSGRFQAPALSRIPAEMLSNVWCDAMGAVIQMWLADHPSENIVGAMQTVKLKLNAISFGGKR